MNELMYYAGRDSLMDRRGVCVDFSALYALGLGVKTLSGEMHFLGSTVG